MLAYAVLTRFCRCLDSNAAMSLKDFNAKPDRDQAVYVVDFIEKMTGDLAAKNPQLARDIRDWFGKRPEGSRSAPAWSACTSNSAPSRYKPRKTRRTCRKSSSNPSSS